MKSQKDKARVVKQGNGLFCIETNYDNQWAVEPESENLTEEQAKQLAHEINTPERRNFKESPCDCLED